MIVYGLAVWLFCFKLANDYRLYTADLTCPFQMSPTPILHRGMKNEFRKISMSLVIP